MSTPALPSSAGSSTERHARRQHHPLVSRCELERVVARTQSPVRSGVGGVPKQKPKALDLFCGAGGAGMGIHLAGFDVVGVDINPQPYYPFEFRQGDALEADLTGFDFVWASPPCQAYTEMQRMHKNSGAHKDLVAPMRAKLEAWGGLWIMENVKGSPLRASAMLCGTMFGLRIAKHRYFEASYDLPLLMPPCDHRDIYDPWHGKGRTADKMREAQGTPWMPSSGGASRKRGETGDTNNAIPPAYAEFLASHAKRILTGGGGAELVCDGVMSVDFSTDGQ